MACEELQKNVRHALKIIKYWKAQTILMKNKHLEPQSKLKHSQINYFEKYLDLVNGEG